MITIRTAHYEHKYHGTIQLVYNEESRMIFVEAHGAESSPSEDELDIWASDVFDAFKVESVISITGE